MPGDRLRRAERDSDRSTLTSSLNAYRELVRGMDIPEGSQATLRVYQHKPASRPIIHDAAIGRALLEKALLLEGFSRVRVIAGLDNTGEKPDGMEIEIVEREDAGERVARRRILEDAT